MDSRDDDDDEKEPTISRLTVNTVRIGEPEFQKIIIPIHLPTNAIIAGETSSGH